MTLSLVTLNRHYQFLIFTVLYSLVSSIKVDFGTRGLPIEPAVPTTIAPPSRPYREPAPVWEDQSNDIADPRPYTYNLPPPSRPRDNNVNVFDPNYRAPQYSAPANPPITPVNNFNNQFGYSLVPIYIPGEGYRYFVVVPVDKWNYLNTNLISDDRHAQAQEKFDKFDKYNGRFNAKLKKYKAYEKALKPEPQQPYQQQTKGTPVKRAGQWSNKQ